MTPDTITLGHRYRDTVSGWTGIVTARYEYLNGCVRYELDGTDDKGSPKGYVFDEQQIEYVDDGVVADLRPPRPAGLVIVDDVSSLRRRLFGRRPAERPLERAGRTGGPRDHDPVAW